MRPSKEAEHYYETYFLEASKFYGDKLEVAILNNKQIGSSFASALESLSLQILAYQKNHVDVWYGIEGSLSISAALKHRPCFIIEAYGEDWYIEQLASIMFPIPCFDEIWCEFREESRRRAKPYVNRIDIFEVDLELIRWLRYTAIGLFQQVYENEVRSIFESKSFLKANKHENFRVGFGPYRGMNQQINFDLESVRI